MENPVSVSSTSVSTSSTAASSSHERCCRVFACLYSKHKTQKRKVWQDGRLVLKGNQAFLYNAQPIVGSGDPLLDQCELRGQIHDDNHNGRLLETEKFLVTIDGPWIEPRPKSSATNVSGSTHTTSSTSMQKLLQGRKFQRPRFVVPSRQRPPTGGDDHPPAFKSRKRPLQPGELYSRYHKQQGSDQQQHQSQHTHTGIQPSQHSHWFQEVESNNSRPQQAFKYSDQNPSVFPSNRHHVSQQQQQQQQQQQPYHDLRPSETGNFSSATEPTQMATATTTFMTSLTSAASQATRFAPAPTDAAFNHHNKENERQQPLKHESIFTRSHGFDETTFYGEEEEENDDNFTANDLLFLGSSNATSTESKNATNSDHMAAFEKEDLTKDDNFVPNNASADDPQPFTLQPTIHVTTAAGLHATDTEPELDAEPEDGTRMTTSQLLDLFGDSNPSASPDEAQHTRTERCNSELLTSSSPAAAYQRTSSAVENTNETEFVLPANDDSSDESSVD